MEKSVNEKKKEDSIFDIYLMTFNPDESFKWIEDKSYRVDPKKVITDGNLIELNETTKSSVEHYFILTEDKFIKYSVILIRQKILYLWTLIF